MQAKSARYSAPKEVSWGRRKHADFVTGLRALALMAVTPALTVLLTINMEHSNGNLWYLIDQATILSFWQQLSLELLLPVHTAIASFLVFQAIIYRLISGRVHTGQYTPAGQLLRYKTNGMAAFFVTNLTYWLGHMCGIYKASFIAKNFSTVVVGLNIWGLALTVAVYIKACAKPTSLGDRVFTGNVLYDLCMGAELNPRLPIIDDLKLFIVGRVGMMVWCLILVSFAALQHERYGYVSIALLAGITLQVVYIIDFFWNEHWYLRTIDIAHDHVGFYISWGCFAWLPATYTLHVQFLVHSDLGVSDAAGIAYFMVGCAGYALFRIANDQKYRVREAKGSCDVWRRPATYITARYTTADEREQEAILLTCGWWGYARHVNYVGDLILSFATCATTGFNGVLPWFYAIYLWVLLMHRCYRDEARCEQKYGKDWQRYCQRVPWRLVPYLF